MELTRLAIVYLYLIACCAAIGIILTSDLAVVKKLLGRDPGEPDDVGHLYHLKRVVCLSLAALWVTGIAIVTMDAWGSGAGYFGNPKIQAKITMVVLLTINGFVLHNAVLPAIEKHGTLARLPAGSLALATVAGSVSAVSWFYAAMLGVGRPLAWKYSLVELLAAYPALVAMGAASMFMLATRARNRVGGDYRMAVA